MIDIQLAVPAWTSTWCTLAQAKMLGPREDLRLRISLSHHVTGVQDVKTMPQMWPQVRFCMPTFGFALSVLLHHVQPRSFVCDSFTGCNPTCSACRATVPGVIEIIKVQRPVPCSEAPTSTLPSSLLAMPRLQTRRLTTAADMLVHH